MSVARTEKLSDLMKIEVRVGAAHRSVEVRLPTKHRDTAAFIVASHIVCYRCGGAPQHIEAWKVRYAGGPPHSPDLLAYLEAFIASDSIGTPTDPAPQVHLEGFVAEHMWHLLTLENALDFHSPLRVDGPGWSVTDQGGDGMVVYCIDGTFAFRLWESKAHTGKGPVRDVISGACRQIDSNALRYLARFSKIGQSIGDLDLRRFYGQLPEMWKQADRNAGGGISVATASSVGSDSFDGLPSYWSFTHEDQRQGMTIFIDSFATFAQSVRKHLWKGL